jgi:hypothetical protein
MDIDASGEDGRGTLLVIYAGWRHWALGSWKISTENAQAILPRIREIAQLFGTPCAVMRDLGRAVSDAARAYIASLDKPIPNPSAQVCGRWPPPRRPHQRGTRAVLLRDQARRA